MSLADCSDVIV